MRRATIAVVQERVRHAAARGRGVPDLIEDPFEEINLETEYGRDRRRLTARFGYGSRVPITEEFAAGGSFELTDFFEFRSSLVSAGVAELRFRSGWENGSLLLLLLPWIALMLASASARTRLVVDAERLCLQIESRRMMWEKPKVRELSLGDIVGVTVAKLGAYRERQIFVPALEISGGDLVYLSEGGRTTPERAEHQVTQLRAFLETIRDE